MKIFFDDPAPSPQAQDDLLILKILSSRLKILPPPNGRRVVYGTARKRTSSRLRRTNDRSVLNVHEDHEDDENAEIGV
jgi:hypothetical protein